MRALLVSVAAAFVLTSAGITLVPRSAHADAGDAALAAAKAIDHTYEIENLDAYADQVFVAWPRICGSKGEPLGAVSLELNPDWTSRLHDVDYEVLVKGKRHELLPYCAETTRIHALPSALFPLSSRVATADDSALGKKPGELQMVLPVLDAIDLQKRIPFFASDPRKVSSPFRFDAVTSVRAGSPLKAVHEVLAIEGAFGGATATFIVQPKRVIYTYEDGASEALPYRGATRPGPRDGVARANADANANANANANADAGASVTEGTPASHDLGTRWVLLAAVGGIVAGGAIAHYRKKRTSK